MRGHAGEPRAVSKDTCVLATRDRWRLQLGLVVLAGTLMHSSRQTRSLAQILRVPRRASTLISDSTLERVLPSTQDIPEHT